MKKELIYSKKNEKAYLILIKDENKPKDDKENSKILLSIDCKNYTSYLYIKDTLSEIIYK